jgi:glycosyltransferase involved in cell wall biosynthesis
MSASGLTYALVTPARNEEANLGRLAGAIDRQTLKPEAWIVVDTGSTDGTVALVRELGRRMPSAQLISIGGTERPMRGAPIVRGFIAGMGALEHAPDVVVKLDADLSFEADYFERLMSAFNTDPHLGLASGICTELHNGQWQPLYGTRSHVWGASRAYRWRCLQEVLPLEERRGWDEIDAIKAQIRGWRVRTLGDLVFRHHRPEGHRDGPSLKRWFRIGGEAHYMGYRFSYLVVRAFWRSLRDPRALVMVGGYVGAVIARQRRCPDTAVRAHLRKEQSMRRLPLRLREAVGRVI